ncbi:hypothetical protein ESA94_17035 [Lacibacter luteus]|uniref:Uncharacterized protein n=1 Tax=Lacibacter luteus TaxID=2508719 RepID=A0A4Q1CEQ7_9BACT|nr:hypothetical protein [Lacibacter luteus]RXK58346.1 hypothetical protein ESA94_17035 [Lacibacter luteus]
MEQESKNGFCFYAGLFGVLMSVVSLFQMFAFGAENWMALAVMIVELLSITAYSFLMAKSRFTLPLLFGSTVLVLLMNILFILTLSFSLIIVFLLIYSIVILSIFWANGYTPYLKQRYALKKKETLEWQNKLS